MVHHAHLVIPREPLETKKRRLVGQSGNRGRPGLPAHRQMLVPKVRDVPANAMYLIPERLGLGAKCDALLVPVVKDDTVQRPPAGTLAGHWIAVGRCRNDMGG